MAGLGFIFVLLPMSIILFLLWIFTKKKFFGVALLIMWSGLITLLVLSFILSPLWEKKVLDKSDFYGQYIIDRNYFQENKRIGNTTIFDLRLKKMIQYIFT